jgi:hypothetical protein
VERLAFWLCAGLTSLRVGGASANASASGSASGASFETGDAALLGGELRESRIFYPLRVDDWQAVGEHLFDEQEYGMSVRYAHGRDRDRWIDVYFYPAGALSAIEFVAAARQEAEMIQQAHADAGYADFDMGKLRDFTFSSSGQSVEGLVLDLSYAAHGTAYSSAMTLLLERLYFVKARFSIEQQTLSRREAREQLLAFTARLQPRLTILNTGNALPSLDYVAAGGSDSYGQPQPMAATDRREIRLQYRADPVPFAVTRPAYEEADAG